MLNVKRAFIFGILLAITGLVQAQQDKLHTAYSFLSKKQLDSAKVLIDEVVLNPETMNDVTAWTVRAFTYKAIFNESEKTNTSSPARLTALSSFEKVISLASAPEEKEKAVQGVKYLISTFYNHSIDNLDGVHYKTAIAMFDKYNEYYSLVDTSKANLRKKNVEFLLALASVYTENFKADKSKDDFLNLAKTTYGNVLTLEPNNISANYNMGILYYNQAVDLINQSDYDLDIVALSDIQDNSIVLFKESLPFMEKANSLAPNRKETLLGLAGIYFSLNEFEKSNRIKQQLKEIEQEK